MKKISLPKMVSARLLTVVAWVFVSRLKNNNEYGESYGRTADRETAPCLGATVECVISDTCIAGMAEAVLAKKNSAARM